VPLIVPLTVSVPDEDADTEPLELGESVPEIVEHPDVVPDAVLELVTDGLCETLCVPLAQPDAVNDDVTVGEDVNDGDPLLLWDREVVTVEHPDVVTVGEPDDETEAL